MSAATSSRSSATSSRSAIGLRARDGRAEDVRPRAAAATPEERVLEALVGDDGHRRQRATASRKKLRDGELDDKEIEVEVADTGSGGMPMLRDPRHAGRQYRRDEPQRHAVGRRWAAATKTRKTTVKESYERR